MSLSSLPVGMPWKVTTSSTPESLIRSGFQWGSIPIGYGTWVSTVVGTGAVTQQAGMIEVDTGATTGGTASVRTSSQGLASPGQSQGVIDWTKRIVLVCLFYTRFQTTNGISRFSFGKATVSGVGNLDRRAIGFRLANTTLAGLSHNGTSQTVTTLNTTLTDEIMYEITIVSDGAGNVEFLVDRVSKGTSTAGPSAAGAVGDDLLQFEVDNGADNARQVTAITYVNYCIAN